MKFSQGRGISSLLLSFNLVAQAATTPGTVLWKFQAGAAVGTAVAIGSDATLYFGSDDKKLYAVRPDGTLKWTFTAGDIIRGSPSLGADGTVYFGSEDQRLYAVSSDGVLRWTFLGNGGPETSPSIGADGTIYFNTSSGHLFAVRADGNKRWDFPVGSSGISAPVIGSDGAIFMGGGDHQMYGINADGTKRWSRDLAGPIYGLALGGDGTIYVGTGTGANRLFALDPAKGTNHWQYQSADNIGRSPIVGPDGAIYYGGVDAKLYALNANGTLRWRYTAAANVQSPALANDGTVLFCSNDNTVTAVDGNGKLRWKLSLPSSLIGAPTIGPGGTIYVGCFDKKLYAIAGDGELANSPWPMSRRDYRHTANLSAVVPPVTELDQPAAGALFTYGSPVLLSASAEAFQATPTNVVFYNGTNLIASATNAPFGFTWTNPPFGSLSLTAVVTDSAGRTGTSAPVVASYNTRISVALTNPPSGYRLLLPGSLQLDASALSLDAPITEVDFLAGTNLVGSVTNPPYSLKLGDFPSGKYQFTARATDALGGNAVSAPVSVAIYAPGQFEATADSYATDEDTPLTVPAPGVLANDVNNTGASLIADLVIPPAKGSLLLKGDGSFQYEPATNANGSDSFSYRLLASGQTSAPAVVQITVRPVNDPPVVLPVPLLTTDQNKYTGITVRGADVESDPLTFRFVKTADHGNAELSSPTVNSIAFGYYPDHNFVGSDSVVIVANDGLADSAPVTINIQVRSVPFAPVAVDDLFAVEAATPLDVVTTGVLTNDYDDNGDHLTARLVTSPKRGTLNFHKDGSFHYAPEADYLGFDSFTYVANDGALDSLPATVNLAVGNERWLSQPRTNGLLGITVMVTAGTNLYVGGTFTNLEGVPANHVAGWDGQHWLPLGGGGQDGLNGVPNGMAIGKDGSLFVCGGFSVAGSVAAQQVARWDGQTWSAVGGGVDGVAYALAVGDDGSLYVGGRFKHAGGLPAASLSRWDGTSWTTVGGGIEPNSEIGALLLHGSDLYAGGGIVKAGSVSVSNVAHWNGKAWDNMGGGVDNFNFVSALAWYDNNLIVGGQFRTAGGLPTANIAGWDGVRWTALATNMQDPGRVVAVNTLAVDGSDLYIGGQFHDLNGVPATGVARWDGSTWHALGTGTESNDHLVTALAIQQRQLFVAGQFNAIGTKPSDGFARWLLAPELVWRVRIEGQSFHAVASAIPGTSYRIERSSDLRTWQIIQTVVATGSQIEFSDVVPSLTSPAYFRARLTQ